MFRQVLLQALLKKENKQSSHSAVKDLTVAHQRILNDVAVLATYVDKQGCTYDSATNAFTEIFFEEHYDFIEEIATEFISKLTSLNDITRVILRGAIQTIIQKQIRALNDFKENILSAIQQMSSNVHNIKHALQQAVDVIDPETPETLYLSTVLMQSGLNLLNAYPHDEIFLKTDLDEQYQQGFEDGFQRCQELQKQTKTTSSRLNINLLDFSDEY